MLNLHFSLLGVVVTVVLVSRSKLMLTMIFDDDTGDVLYWLASAMFGVVWCAVTWLLSDCQIYICVITNMKCVSSYS